MVLITQTESDLHNEVTFTSSITDISTGLQYIPSLWLGQTLNARFYDASTGRFLTQDSYSGNPYDPWTQHLYSYCENNPTNFVDPTGHSIKAIKNQIAKVGKEISFRTKLIFGYSKSIIENYDDKDRVQLLGNAIIRNSRTILELSDKQRSLLGDLEKARDDAAAAIETLQNIRENIGTNQRDEVDEVIEMIKSEEVGVSYETKTINEGQVLDAQFEVRSGAIIASACVVGIVTCIDPPATLAAAIAPWGFSRVGS